MAPSKRPWLARLDDEAIEDIQRWEPQFIFSHAVLQHVPEQELPVYFERLGRMMKPGCVAVVMFPAASGTKRLKAMSWAYPEPLLEGVALHAIEHARINFIALPDRLKNVSGGARRLMIIRRSDQNSPE